MNGDISRSSQVSHIMEGNNAVTPRCVGSTGNDYRCSVRDTLGREAKKKKENVEGGHAFSDGYSMHEESNCFKSAQWYGLITLQTSTPPRDPP